MRINKEELKNIRCVSNNVLIRVEKICNDNIELKNGKKLYLAADFNPDNNMNVIGTIIKKPDRIVYNKKGAPQQSLGWLTDVEVNEGDTVYMDYVAIAQAYGKYLHTKDEQVNTEQIVFCEQELYVFLNYGHLIFSKKKEKIKMLNGYVLLSPVMEKGLSSKTVVLSDDSKLIQSERFAKVEYKGSLIRDYFDFDNSGDNFDVNIGDIVTFDKWNDIEVEYTMHQKLNKKYFRMQRKNISSVIPKEMYDKLGIVDS